MKFTAPAVSRLKLALGHGHDRQGKTPAAILPSGSLATRAGDHTRLTLGGMRSASVGCA